MKVWVVEYWGGMYSDSWDVIKGVFSSREAAIEWIHKNPNDIQDYVFSKETESYDNFSIFVFEVDDPDVIESEASEWFFHPELVQGVTVKVIGYEPNAGQLRQSLLGKIGTITERHHSFAKVRFGKGKLNHHQFQVEYLEKHE